MAQSIKRLAARYVTTETKRGRYADGGGLYLQVSANEAKSWLFRFTFKGKARQMGLGSLHTVTLVEAREDALQCRKLLRDGIDPIERRKLERGQAQADSVKVMTFKECAEGYINAHSASWKNGKHASQWPNTLAAYVYPLIGDLPVQTVNTGLVMKVLGAIWYTKTETARRVRSRIEVILDWATVREFRQGENPARWKGHLDNQLPAASTLKKVKHHAAMPYEDMGGFMVKLRQQNGVSALGLEFQILTAARTGEVIKARWAEFNFDKALWIIPGERMKVGKEHRVPLSVAAMAVLAKQREVSVNEFVFPGMRRNTSLSNMAFLKLLERMKISKDLAVPHGFRSTFRDWASEQTNFPHEVAEMALAHTIDNKTEAAYRRGDLFEKRRHIMDDWAVQCASSSAVT